MPKELPLFVDVSELRILGIDPGLASIGYGIIHETTALDYGAITTPKTLSLPLRLNGIHLDILELVRLYEPEAVAIEYPFFGRDNPNQGLVLQALGVIRMALAEAGLSEHILLHQSTIKSAIASYGADKKDIQAAVQSIFNLPTLPKPDDAADGKRDRLCSSMRSSLKHQMKTCAIPPKTYLPVVTNESPPNAVQAVVDCIQVYGWRVFQAIIGATSMETRGRLLAVLVSGLPQGLLEEFRGLVGSA